MKFQLLLVLPIFFGTPVFANAAFSPEFGVNHQDTIPAKREAQDFNTTRSNRQNSALIIINTGNNRYIIFDSVPNPQQAQDFNTTRSNRQNSNYQAGIVTNKGNANSKDNIPLKQEAQDFNTTRSNGQNSALIIINTGNNRYIISDNVPNPQQAQDFNTTRSNRQNSNYQAGLGTNNGNANSKDSISAKQEAQDFNTTRSNRQNSALVINVEGNTSVESLPNPQQAQDFNTTRSNRQNSNYQAGLVTNNGNANSKDSISAKQEAQDFNTTRSNRQNSALVINVGSNGDIDILPNPQQAQDFNTTRSNRQNSNYQAGLVTNNGNANSKDSISAKQEAQDFNTTRSNRQNSNYQAGIVTNNGNANSKADGLLIQGGFSSGNSRHTGNGWSTALGYQYPISQIFKLEAGVSFSSVKFEYNASAVLPVKYLEAMEASIQDNAWRVVTVNLGPAIQIRRNQFGAEWYGKAGVSFIHTPNQFIGTPDAGDNVSDLTGVAKFGGNTTNVSLQTGVRLHYAVDRRLSIFLNPHYFTTLGSKLSYTEKNAVKALEQNGDFNLDTFAALPFEKRFMQLSIIGLNAGIKISL